MKSDYQTMQQVLVRLRVLNDRLSELGLDMPPLPVALEELVAYRGREYAELCFYRATLDAPDLMLYDAYEAIRYLRLCWLSFCSADGRYPIGDTLELRPRRERYPRLALRI